MRSAFAVSRVLALAALGISAVSPANAQQAGSLISAEPVVQTPDGMQAWRVAYWTADGNGRARQATGMVVAPREAIPARPRNVLAWTHGTWGVASRCAPSLSPNFWQVTAGLEAVRNGDVVVAPDYPGLGSDGVHPFLVGVDTGRSVLDAFVPPGKFRERRQAAALPSGESPKAGMRRSGRGRLRHDTRRTCSWWASPRRRRQRTWSRICG